MTKVFRTLCWAVYLGCSWTWCIGMFLPVLLVSEFGNPVWFLFAIPNVIGAAAMGWTLARPGASQKMVAGHRAACVAFTAVTFAFHLFFLFWLASIRMIPVDLAIGAICCGVVFGLISRWVDGLDLLLGWIVLGVSLVVFARGLAHPVWGVADPLNLVPLSTAMIGLAPICLLGFLLCPYLDLTFHRARQKTPVLAGKVAFAIGFGLVFLLMIVLTMLYAGDFARDRSIDDRFGSFGGQLLITWVATHIATQIGFTFTAHLRALPPPRRGDLAIWIGGGVLVAIAIFTVHQEMWSGFSSLRVDGYSPAMATLRRTVNYFQPRAGMLNGDLLYRLFLSFYGLVFPAYVWICMVPIKGQSPGTSRRALVIVGVSLALAGPMFWLGFISERMLWLIPGVAVVLTARIFAGSHKAADVIGGPGRQIAPS